jgi:hypothetical protein
MKKQTAVEWLVQYIHSEEYQKAFGQTYISIELVDQAKAMEKEQMINAFDNGEACWYDDFSDYYTSTYEK